MFNVSKFIPNKEHSRIALIFCFRLKKTAAKLYRLLQEDRGEHVPSQDMCERWFRSFRSGDIDIRQEGRQGTWKRIKKFEDVKLLDEDDSQTQKQLVE